MAKAWKPSMSHIFDMYFYRTNLLTLSNNIMQPNPHFDSSSLLYTPRCHQHQFVWAKLLSTLLSAKARIRMPFPIWKYYIKISLPTNIFHMFNLVSSYPSLWNHKVVIYSILHWYYCNMRYAYVWSKYGFFFIQPYRYIFMYEIIVFEYVTIDQV